MRLKFAWHTGSVPQRKRREEINRFKQDPECRLFISTDSGATGLNLQAANIVINLDLPWNPAKLEQRIARAWRKHQTRSVEVINLVCEDSIEHRMVAMLAQKQQLADGVLDGRGDLHSMKMPSGKTAFIERLQGLMGTVAPKAVARAESPKLDVDSRGIDAFDRFRQDMLSRLDNRLLGLESHTQPNGRCSILAVVDDSPDRVKPIVERLLRECFDGPEEPPLLELVDRHTLETIQRLSQAGFLKVETAHARTLYTTPLISSPVKEERERLREQARMIMTETARKIKLSAHLQAGGFSVEALPILSDAVELSLKALCCLAGEKIETSSDPVPLAQVEGLLTTKQLVSGDAAFFIARLRDSKKNAETVAEETANSLVTTGFQFMDRAEQAVARSLIS
jgi:superfamily II DNA/RNA helicase